MAQVLRSHLKISKLSQVINILYSSTLVLLRGTGLKITQTWTIFTFSSKPKQNYTVEPLSNKA